MEIELKERFDICPICYTELTEFHFIHINYTVGGHKKWDTSKCLGCKIELHYLNDKWTANSSNYQLDDLKQEITQKEAIALFEKDERHPEDLDFSAFILKLWNEAFLNIIETDKIYTVEQDVTKGLVFIRNMQIIHLWWF